MWPSKTRPATFLLSIRGERQPGLLPTLLGGPTAISHCARSLRGLDQHAGFSKIEMTKKCKKKCLDRTRRLRPIHCEKWKHHFEIFWDPLILFWSYFCGILPLRFIRCKHPIQFITASWQFWLAEVHRQRCPTRHRQKCHSAGSISVRLKVCLNVIRCDSSYNLRNACQVLENCVQILRSPWTP